MVLQDSILYIGGNFYTYDNEEAYYLTTIIYPWSAFVVSNKELIASTSGIELYPNPGNGEFNVRIPASWARNDTKLVIRDLQGKQTGSPIISFSAEGLANVKSTLQSGIYLVEISSGTERRFQKIVVN
jgi:hypothetical protein